MRLQQLFFYNLVLMLIHIYMAMKIIMIIFIHKKDTLQIMSKNKQQSRNLRMPVEGYKNIFG